MTPGKSPAEAEYVVETIVGYILLDWPATSLKPL